MSFTYSQTTVSAYNHRQQTRLYSLAVARQQYLNIIVAPLAEQLDLLGTCRCHIGLAV